MYLKDKGMFKMFLLIFKLNLICGKIIKCLRDIECNYLVRKYFELVKYWECVYVLWFYKYKLRIEWCLVLGLEMFF